MRPLSSWMFQSGSLVETRSISDATLEHQPFLVFVLNSLMRHFKCDWGDLSHDDWAANDAALEIGERLFSSYNIPVGLYTLADKVWIITDSDRSYTTILFPSDY